MRRPMYVSSLALLALTSAPAFAQAGPAMMPTGASTAPPVLSTEATPPAGMPSQPGSMTGLPLQVGDLPPGAVAVRLVHQPYTNIVGHEVELRVGAEGRPMRAVTGNDGRAQFTGIAVGEHVMAVATVDGERLTSQLFQVPAQGGVRVLLATGQGGPTMGPAAVTTAADTGIATLAPVSSPRSGTPQTAIVLTCVFALAGAGVWLSGRRRSPPKAATPSRRGSPSRTESLRAELLSRREALYAELVRLELEPERGTHGPSAPAQRDALLAQLDAVYSALGDPLERA